MHKAQWLGETEGEMGLTRESKNGGDWIYVDSLFQGYSTVAGVSNEFHKSLPSCKQ